MGGFPRVVVDLEALSHNFQKIRSIAAGCRVMAVVKANAYGHGLVAVARALGDADALAVARTGEAQTLREAGIRNEIVLLEGVADEQELRQAADLGLTLVVHTANQLRLLEAFSGAKRFRCWLKLDTGMHRLGFTADDSRTAMARILRCRSVAGSPGLMTHLAGSELPDDPTTAEQIRAFADLSEGWPGELSIANSAAILLRPETRTGWVRPGLALYGLSPVAGRTGRELGMRPAMQLVTRLISVKTVPAGGSVGYNGTWTAGKATRIGIAAVGYGDGYPRSLGNGTPVLVDGQRASLAGRVSMDMIAIDLSAVSDAVEGSEVTLWGPDLPVEEIAGRAGTIPYELVCNVSARVATLYASAPVAMA